MMVLTFDSFSKTTEHQPKQEIIPIFHDSNKQTIALRENLGQSLCTAYSNFKQMQIVLFNVKIIFKNI